MQYNNTPNDMSVQKPIRDLKDIYYLSVKATLNRWVFRRDLKFSIHDACLISAGYLFHKVRAAKLTQ